MIDLERERQLIVRAQQNGDGFGAIFDLYYDRIYAYAYRRVGSVPAAEDIAACTFEDALRGLKRFHWQNKPIVAWLYRIAARRVVDYFRRPKEMTDDAAELTDLATPSLEHAAERSEEQAAVRSGLETLNSKDREIIQLAYFDELETAEIASLLGCTSNAVYVRLHRALARLERVLKEREYGVE